MSVCKSCRAPVAWVRLASGRRMPIDPEPSPRGNVVVGPEFASVLAGLELEELRLQTQLYTSHFATCPDADSHRRVRSAAG